MNAINDTIVELEVEKTALAAFLLSFDGAAREGVHSNVAEMTRIFLETQEEIGVRPTEE